MRKLPAFQFYPGDWMKDPSLRRCSHAARGVWIDMLCLMFECAPRGVLVTGSSVWSREDVAMAVGGNADVTLRCIDELVSKGVCKVREDGALYSSRMIKDEEERCKTRERVKKHREKRDCNDIGNDPVTLSSHCSSASTSVNNTPSSREGADEEGGDSRRPRTRWVPFPSWMPDDLKAAFTDWHHHLFEKGISATTMQQQGWYMDCQRNGIPRAIETIRFSISKGAKSLLWDGPINRGSHQQQHRSTADREFERTGIRSTAGDNLKQL